MSLALALAAAIVLVAFFVARSKRGGPAVLRDSTPAVDAWIAEALELELAENALGMRASTPEERKKLAQSLRGSPDPEVVTAIEDKVKSVDLEWVKYAHEGEAQLTLRVTYEDGKTGTTTKCIASADIPDSVRADFDRLGTSRVFRSWSFPWARARAM